MTARQNARPRYTPVQKDMFLDLYEEGIDGVSALVYATIITSRRCAMTGVVIDPTRVIKINGVTTVQVLDALDDLHRHGKIVHDPDRGEVLVRAWFRRNAAIGPRTLSAAAYDSEKMGSHPCMAVLASEVLRFNIAELPADQQVARYDGLNNVWAELTGQPMPPMECFTGDAVRAPDMSADVWAALGAKFDRDALRVFFEKDSWVSFSKNIRDHVRAGFGAD